MTDDGIELTRRKILASVGAVGVAGAGAGLGTSAYFSDQETFTNNELMAGDLDMKVAWQEHYSDWKGAETNFARMPDGEEDPSFRLPPSDQQPDGRPIELLVEDGQGFLGATREKRENGGLYPGDSSFADLCGTDADVPEQPLIDLKDVKPGDFGFGLFRFQLCTNPGYVWLNGGLVEAAENSHTEPEAEDPDEEGPEDEKTSDLDNDVELLDEIQVAYGVGTTNDLSDDNPEANLFPEGEQVDGAPQPAEQLSLREFLYLLETDTGLPLDGDIDAADGGGTGRDCFAGETEHYVSVVWWLPIDHGNQVQTDKVTFDLGFYTEQCRHNDGTDLTAYYPLDSVEDDNTVADLSGNGNDGTVKGGVSSVDGKVQNAASFDGDGDAIATDLNVGASGESLTVSGWLKAPSQSFTNNHFFLGNYLDRPGGGFHDGFFAIGSDDGDKMYFWTRDQSTTNSVQTGSYGPAFDDEWHHYVGVRDAGAEEIRFYIDGDKKETAGFPGDVAIRDPDSFFGMMKHFDTRYLEGDVDDVRIYNRALSDAEVQTLSDL